MFETVALIIGSTFIFCLSLFGVIYGGIGIYKTVKDIFKHD